MRTQAITLALVVLSWCWAATGFGYESERAGFILRVNDLEIPYRVFAVYVLPAETLEIHAVAAAPESAFGLSADSGTVEAISASSWRWRAPTTVGVHSLRVVSAGDQIQLNMVVMRPAAEIVDGRINGFRVGNYPTEPLNGNALYLPPDGFIELTEATAALKVSPHFELWQFPSKQSGDFPKYLVLREQLLLKLELLLEHLNQNGIAAETLTVMSGFRTPFYNAAIGNVPYSRHVYGGAADIYIDAAPRDDIMDDLNGDGRSDYRDAQYLYRLADTLFSEERYRELRGGIGVYRSNSAHGPFLHIDARQQRARWGLRP
jgi:hypothetical protein